MAWIRAMGGPTSGIVSILTSHSNMTVTQSGNAYNITCNNKTFAQSLLDLVTYSCTSNSAIAVTVTANGSGGLVKIVDGNNTELVNSTISQYGDTTFSVQNTTTLGAIKFNAYGGGAFSFNIVITPI